MNRNVSGGIVYVSSVKLTAFLTCGKKIRVKKKRKMEARGVDSQRERE